MVSGVDEISNASVTNICNIQKLICINRKKPLVAVPYCYFLKLIDNFVLREIVAFSVEQLTVHKLVLSKYNVNRTVSAAIVSKIKLINPKMPPMAYALSNYILFILEHHQNRYHSSYLLPVITIPQAQTVLFREWNLRPCFSKKAIQSFTGLILICPHSASASGVV